jgi:ankyrin repeat protein
MELRASHKSYQDVDLAPDELFRERLRDICGVFVTAMESKIYLLHQTAREFLVRADSGQEEPAKQPENKNKTKFRWKHSLEMPESHRILGEICLWNLQFPEPLSDTVTGDIFQLNARMRDYDFLEYSVYFWTLHLGALHVKIDKQMTEAMVAICHACHRHRPFWLRAKVQETYPTKRADINANLADDPNSTVLMIASCLGLAPAVEALIKTGGGSLLARDSKGRTALAWAAAYGRVEAAKVLIENSQSGMFSGLGWLGIWKPAIIETADNSGYTPLMWAANAGSQSLVKLLLDKGADIEARDDLDRAALLSTFDTAVLRLRLERGADVNARGPKGTTALMDVSQDPNGEDNVRLLLRHGAKIDEPEPRGEGFTPLIAAIELQREGNIKALLEHHANVTARGTRGHTPFTMACDVGMLDLVKLLLEKGVGIDDKGVSGVAGLSCACSNGHEAVVRFLVERGADVNSVSDNGFTPLFFTWSYGTAFRPVCVSISQYLLDSGADLETKDSKGTTVLAHLASFGYVHAVRRLLENGADIEARNVHGQTPLAWIAAYQNGAQCIPLLLKAGADINATARDGKSALQLAIVIQGSLKGFELLLEHGADIEHRDDSGRTALSYAAGCSRTVEFVELLLAKGADVHSRDGRGMTPLFWATGKTVNTAVAKMLIEHGADVHVKDDDGGTPLSLACSEEGNPQTALLLREMGGKMS